MNTTTLLRRNELVGDRSKTKARLLRSKELASRQAKLLSIEERDAQYRLVNQDLTIIARHRQVLRERGLADNELHRAVELGALRHYLKIHEPELEKS